VKVNFLGSKSYIFGRIFTTLNILRGLLDIAGRQIENVQNVHIFISLNTIESRGIRTLSAEKPFIVIVEFYNDYIRKLSKTRIYDNVFM
jgi:hypothetical protein